MLLKFFVGIVLFFTVFSRANANWFELIETKKVIFDFYGSAYNGNSIIVYGNAGDILISTDKGKQWEQVKINDSLVVVGITNIGKNFYGITNQKYGLTSSDNGKSWELIDLGEGLNFYKLIKYNEFLYCLTQNEILVFDRYFKKVKEYSLSTDTLYCDFAIANYAIVYSSGKGKIGFVDLKTSERSIYNLDSLGICTNCPTPISFFSDNYSTYFILDTLLYQFYVPTKKIELFVKPIKVSSAFSTFQNQVYQIFTNSNFSYNLDSLYFVKYYKSNNSPVHIKKSGNDRRIFQLSFNHFNFLSGDTIIAVGNRKLIYISYNGGINWSVASYASPYSGFYLFDSLNAKTLYPCIVLSYTSNGGTTWLPSKSFHTWFSKFREKSSLPSNGGEGSAQGFLDENRGFRLFYKSHDADTNFAYTFDGGETFNIRLDTTLRDLDAYVTVQKYNKVILLANNYTAGYGRYFITYHFDESLYPKQVSYLRDVHIMDAGFAGDKIIAIGSIGNKPADTLKYAIFISNDNGLNWSKVSSIKLPERVYFSSFRCVGNNIYFQFYYFTGPYMTGKQIVLTYLYSFSQSEPTLLWIDTVEKGIFNKAFVIEDIAELGGKLYMTYYYSWEFDFGTAKPPTIYTKVCENPSTEPTIWKDVDISKERYRLIWVLPGLKDKTKAILVFDSLAKGNILLFAKEKELSPVVETQVENAPSIYITGPNPQPARTLAKMKIYHDSRLNVEEADFRAYNLMGMEVAGKESFLLNHLNHYSAELVWRTDGLLPGVYIVVIRIGNNTHSTTVIKE